MYKYIWETYMPPFRAAGNIYFVGTIPASSHLIDTGDGLIILDTAYPESLYLIMDGIRQLGFSPYDIKYILHSHGHVDHFGSTRALAELTGAKTIISRRDQDYATGSRDLSCAKELGIDFKGYFTPDILLDDGDVFSLGNTEIHCVLTPGHTEGTMSYFFDTVHNGKTYHVGYQGGAGMNTLSRSYLEKNNLPLSLQEDFRNSIKRLRQYHPDIFIANHQEQCDTAGKYARIKAGDEDAFIDPSAWDKFLDKCDKNINDLLQKEMYQKEV